VIAADRSVRIWGCACRQGARPTEGAPGGLQMAASSPQRQNIGRPGSHDTTSAVGCCRRAEGLTQAPPVEFGRPKRFSSLWGDLAGDGCTKACQGVERLAAGAKQALPFLGNI